MKNIAFILIVSNLIAFLLKVRSLHKEIMSKEFIEGTFIWGLLFFYGVIVLLFAEEGRFFNNIFGTKNKNISSDELLANKIMSYFLVNMSFLTSLLCVVIFL